MDVSRGADGRPLPVSFGPTLEDLDALGAEPPAKGTPPAAAKPGSATATPSLAAPATPAGAAPPGGKGAAAGSKPPALYVPSDAPAPLGGPDFGPPHGPPSDPFPDPTAPHLTREEHFWVQADYLMWWYKTGSVPPLLTSITPSPQGPHGTALIDNLSFTDDFHSGIELRAGWHPGHLPFGLEFSYFYMEDRKDSQEVTSSGTPVLGRPYFNTALQREDVFLIAAPGSPGSFQVDERSRLWGLDWNGACCIVGDETWSVVGLLGFRYLDLREDLVMTDHLTTEAAVPIFGAVPAVVTDQFATRNQLYAGQLGVEAEWHCHSWFLNCRAEGALGDNRQTVFILGNSTLTTPSGKVSLPAGRFALPTNIGTYVRDEIAFSPDVTFNVGCQVTQRLRIHVGYTFLYLNNVVRPSGEIDRGVNPNLVPTAVGPGGPAGPARPVFSSHETDFWAQGFNAGLEFHY
jgi:hypothetical protein